MPLRRVALVLGGGGLKGFAHIGVLNALAEHGIVPSLFAGSSIGSLLAAAHLTGMSTDEMARRASTLQRRDLFRMNHVEVLMSRMRARSIYLEEPLRALIESIIPDIGFEDLTAAFPHAQTAEVEKATSASDEWAAALRDFCQRVAG